MKISSKNFAESNKFIVKINYVTLIQGDGLRILCVHTKLLLLKDTILLSIQSGWNKDLFQLWCQEELLIV